MRCDGLPLVMMALVWGGTLNSSAANLSTAVKGAASGTLNLREFRTGGSDRPGSGPGPAGEGSRSRERSDPWERELVTHTLKGSLGSEVRMILKDTFPPPPAAPPPAAAMGCREEKPRGPRERTRRWVLLGRQACAPSSDASPSPSFNLQDQRQRAADSRASAGKQRGGCVFLRRARLPRVPFLHISFLFPFSPFHNESLFFFFLLMNIIICVTVFYPSPRESDYAMHFHE
jgi:hypothetical protein